MTLLPVFIPCPACDTMNQADFNVAGAQQVRDLVECRTCKEILRATLTIGVDVELVGSTSFNFIASTAAGEPQQ